jgi:hypothetical protein
MIRMTMIKMIMMMIRVIMVIMKKWGLGVGRKAGGPQSDDRSHYGESQRAR